MMFNQDKRNKNKDCGPMMEKAREILEQRLRTGRPDRG